MKLRTLLGTYPNTRALREGRIRPSLSELDFADVKTPNRAFKSVVRELAFDIAELAIMTFLQAKAWGKPLVLVPARVGPARFQHQCLVYNTERGKLKPTDLRRIGVRAYAQTTVTWVRGFLAEEHGVPAERVRWITLEDGHVAEYRDPPHCERAPAGKELVAMLLSGEIDAAIIGNELPDDPRVQPLFADHGQAAKNWARRHKAVPINHMIVVKESLSRGQPEVVRELYRLLQESRKAGGSAEKSEFDMAPYGVEANRSALQTAIDYCVRDGMLPRKIAVDELFDATTRGL
jgi:4,5-dihydroxyphthalate decarboxylase